jgi:Ca-activated chloride channel family protein
MELLFSAPVEASAENVSEARRFAKSLEADGGTEMVEPLRTALIDADPSAKDRLRQVVFLTDGAIGNEQEMFEILARKLGRSRVFMVGIGSAPNTFLMTRMAEIGRGTFTHIGDVRQVESRMRELLDKLDTPAVTDIDVKLIGLTGEVTPETAPDLYRGEPLVFLAQIRSVEGQIEVSGEISDRHWSMRMPVSSAQAGKGISQLWARRKIDDAEVAASLGEISDDEADKRILEIALAHHMISRRTSLVAVDKTPARPRDAVLRRSEVPLNLPAGWDFDNVFGEAHETRHASGTFGNVLVRAAATASDQPGDQTLVLPQTATPSGLLLLIGLLTLLLSGLIATLSRLMSHP